MIDAEQEKYVRLWLVDYINKHCLYRCLPDKSMRGKKINERYTAQFYLRRGLFDHTFATMVSHLFWKMFAQEFERNPFQIAGLETSSTPLLLALPLVGKSYGFDLNAFSIRKDQKSYGLHNWTEGRIIPDMDVLLVDDISGACTTLKRAIHILQWLKLPVMKTSFVVINKKTVKTPCSKNMDIAYLFQDSEFDMEYTPEKEWDKKTYDSVDETTYDYNHYEGWKVDAETPTTSLDETDNEPEEPQKTKRGVDEDVDIMGMRAINETK